MFQLIITVVNIYVVMGEKKRGEYYAKAKVIFQVGGRERAFVEYVVRVSECEKEHIKRGREGEVPYLSAILWNYIFQRFSV